jgi:signal transduction histidine kinase
MIRPVFTFILLGLLQLFVQPVKAEPIAVKGVLDLRQQHGIDQILTLKGEWEFYWKELLLPNQFKKDSITPAYVSVPSYWTSYDDQITAVSRFGYGTYRLRVLLPPGLHDSLSLKIPVFDSSYELFLNGSFIFKNGQVGTSKTLSDPGYLPYIHSFLNMGDTLGIVIHVSNYFHRSGGFWLDMQLGKKEAVLKQSEKKKLITYAITGILFGAFLLFLSFYILDRKNLSFLYFSLTAVGLLLRLINTGFYPAHNLLELSWLWTVRLEYTGTFMVLTFGVLYLGEFYPSRIIKVISRINAALFLLLTLIVVITEPWFFGYFTYAVFLLGALFLSYFLYRSFRYMLQYKIKDSVLFISIVLVILAAVNDALLSQSISSIKNEYLLSYTFLLFIAVQVLLLITAWVNNYNEKNQLYNELQHINQNLESIIRERTNELTQTNKELEKTLSIKNRIYSIIAHDLKSPVATLAQYADLIAEKSDNDENKKIIHELQKLSYSSIDLIENMLHWGLKQEKGIQFRPENVQVDEVVREIMKLAATSANEKKIHIDIHIDEGLTAFCDVSLLKISLRNLITNAIKFTPQNGTVTINASTKENTIHIKVSDTGVGMEEEQIEKILSDMASPTKGTSGERGTGLGLLVVRDLIKLNKGTLSIKSKPGRGTSVTFTLPGKP